MASEISNAEPSNLTQGPNLRSDNNVTGVRVYTEEELNQALVKIGLKEDEIINLNLCNNFLLLQLAEFFSIPQQIMCTAMSLCQRYCICNNVNYDRFAIVVGSFHLALKNHSYLLHVKDITLVALHLEYNDQVEGYLKSEMFRKVKVGIEQAQLDILKANHYNSNSSAYLQMKVTMVLLVHKGLWKIDNESEKEFSDFSDTALRLLLWSYGSKVVLMLPQNQLALVIICITYKVMDRQIPEYQGLPIWYYAGMMKDQMLQIVKQLVDFYRINWTMSDRFDFDDFLDVITEDIKSFQEPGQTDIYTEGYVGDGQLELSAEDRWNDSMQQTSDRMKDSETGQENGDVGKGTPQGKSVEPGQVEEGEIAD